MVRASSSRRAPHKGRGSSGSSRPEKRRATARPHCAHRRGPGFGLASKAGVCPHGRALRISRNAFRETGARGPQGAPSNNSRRTVRLCNRLCFPPFARFP